MEREKYISIGEAAELMGLSIDTLRRWDASGHFRAAVRTPGKHRLYSTAQVELFLKDLGRLGLDWAGTGITVPSNMYCERSVIFQARLDKFGKHLLPQAELAPIASLVVAVCGEIGNNSFDHNLGQWPDIPGVFFAYDVEKRIVVLADRGRGVLATLARVRPTLRDDAEALEVAFTEVVSGRAPENRGNGLKFVRKVAIENPIQVSFQSGSRQLTLDTAHPAVAIIPAADEIRGCYAVVRY